MVKFNYFSGKRYNVKERFEIFFIDHYEGDIWNKDIPDT